MNRTDIARILIFNDSMEYVLLRKEDALAPLGGPMNSHSLFQEVQRIMHPIMNLSPTSQPFWWHMRTESFPSAETYVHVFFGKVSMGELQNLERANGDTIIINTGNLSRGPHTIAHRLKYLIPMAMVLSELDSRHWPKP